MLRHYVKITVRNLLRHKSYAFINIVGLAAGMTCCLLALLYIQAELSYDTRYTDYDRIFRVVSETNAKTPSAAAPWLMQEFPEIVASVRLLGTSAAWLMQYENKRFYEYRVYRADSTLFDVFTIPLVRGDPKKVLAGSNTAVISESMAKKYFGDEDPVGKVIRGDAAWNFTVTGVMRDFPGDTHFTADMFLSWRSGNWFVDNWVRDYYYTYVKVVNRKVVKTLVEKCNALLKREINPMVPDRSFFFVFQPLTSIHLHSHLNGEMEANGNILYLYILSAGALFLLLIACINFINLSMARSSTRTKEVGIRKVMGADRQRVAVQFLGESMVISVLVTVLAMAMAVLLLPAFSAFLGKDIPFSALHRAVVLFGISGVTLLVGFLSGGYPALVMSRFTPITALQGRLGAGGGSAPLRRFLIISQFAMTIGLIVNTGVVYRQLDYIRNRPLGFNPRNVIVVPLVDAIKTLLIENFKKELKQNPSVEISTSNYVPGRDMGRGVMWTCYVRRLDSGGVTESIPMRMPFVEYNYFKVLEVKFKAGHTYSSIYDVPWEKASNIVLNETAARQLGWSSPDQALGSLIELKTLNLRSYENISRMTVVGVVEDFHFTSLHHPVEPVIFFNAPHEFMMIRIPETHHKQVLGDLKTIWSRRYPNIPFIYTYLSEDIAKQYQSDRRLGRIFAITSAAAITLACLGLFSLAAFTTRQRTKEIGVRKVFGASIPQITVLLSKEFIVLVAFANVIAWPLAYLCMKRWLQDFSYRTDMGFGVFLAAGLSALIISLCTISAHTIRAARANPVEALRYE